MKPQHSYTLNSQTKSTALAATIAAATTPLEITAAISAVENHLSHHSADQNRHFFSLTFPTFISQLFGFVNDTVSSPKPLSWLETASFDPQLAQKLFVFLSPTGTLINSIFNVDRLSLVQFVFPNERLPNWFRLSKDCRVLNDLCVFLKGRVVEGGVILNVFEYFVFWFAYYPVSKGDSGGLGAVNVTSSRKSRLENWTSSIPVLSSGVKQSTERKDEGSLYLRILYAYLCEFVPVDEVNVHQPYRSSLLHYSQNFDDSVVVRAEFLVDVFVNYWLVDNDVSPLAVNVCKTFGISFPFRSVLGETPPTSGLGEVVKLFTKYLNLSSVEGTKCDTTRKDYVGSSGNKKLSSGEFVKTREVVSWNGHIQRPLYRFILRTFLFCPMGSSMKNISEVFSVWADYIEPWKLSKEEFSEFGASKNSTMTDSGQLTQQEYSPIWEGYVLSNYLFYTSLVMHFIGFAHKFLHTDAEVIVRMVSKVMDILTSSKGLLDLIKNVDTAIHSKSSVGSKTAAISRLQKFAPQIREQLQDWEDCLSENDADGSFLHENWNRDLRLFSDGEDGGPQILQLFILRAENELQAISGDNLSNDLQCIHSLKTQLHCLFGDRVVSQSPQSPRTIQRQQVRDDLFKPRRVLNGSIGHIKCTSDWSRRPISNDEVAWLARFLIQLSIWLNESLGLNQAGTPSNDTPYVEVPIDVVSEYGVPDSLRAVVASMSSWLNAVRLAIVTMMIRHGLKVNLRVFASKKFVMAVFVFFLFRLLRTAFRSIW